MSARISNLHFNGNKEIEKAFTEQQIDKVSQWLVTDVVLIVRTKEAAKLSPSLSLKTA